MDKAEEKEPDYSRNEHSAKEDVYTNVVRAGKRTYFFDVKATRNDDYYLTITESKKNIDNDGRIHYEKHKIFLYKEDFEKFINGLTDAVSFIGTEAEKDENGLEYTNVDFEDLGEK